MKTRILSIAAAALIALPAAAQADSYTFGVDVDKAAPASLTENHQADTLFFNPPGQANTHASPVDGEVVDVRIKGTIIPRLGTKRSLSFEPLYHLFHIQTLHPETNGTYTVTSSTQHLYFPVEVDPNTITSFRASLPQCVAAGDVVDFNNIGGWDGDMGDPHGTTYQIFGPSAGNSVYWYERDNGTNIGSNWLPNRKVDNGNGVTDSSRGPITDTQLLMQVTVATGYDAAVNCPGGRKGQEYHGVTISTPDPAPKVYDDGVARVRVSCPENTKTGCSGNVKLEAEGMVLGWSDTFNLVRSETTNVKLRLSPEAAGLLAQRGTLDATATSNSKDGYDVATTTTGTVRLTSARPAVTGYAGTQARAQVVKVTSKTKSVTLKATCPAGTVGSCSGIVAAQSQKRIKLRAAQKKGNLYKMATGSYTILPGKTARFPITLTSSGKKVLKKVRTIVAIAQLDSKDGAGRAHSERVKVTFKYSGK